MIRRKSGKRLSSPVVKVSSDVRYDIVIDQRSGSDVCLNYAGWPANEITLLVKLQRENSDSALVGQLERSLMELPTPQVDNSAKSNEELISEVIPKYVGTFSEYMKWVLSKPLSAAERAILDEQAKQQFGDGESVESIPVATGGESS